MCDVRQKRLSERFVFQFLLAENEQLLANLIYLPIFLAHLSQRLIGELIRGLSEKFVDTYDLSLK